MSGFRKTIINATVAISLGVVLSTAGASAADQAPTARKASFAPPEASVKLNRPSLEGVARGLPAGDDNALVFSAPPRETEEEALRIYQPIAEYLSRIIGKTVVYRYSKDWLTYQKQMQQGSYDIVFDGPHLNSWRISNLQHNTLVKLADEYAFVVVVRKKDKITNLKQLAGLKICGMTPPDFGTLAVLGQFDNPARQPIIINTLGSTKVYEGVAIKKQCNAGILPVASVKKFNKSATLLRAIYMTQPIPNEAFSAGPRITSQDQALIAAALLSKDGSPAIARLVSAYGADKGLAYASKDEYAGLDAYLKNSWGYAR